MHATVGRIVWIGGLLIAECCNTSFVGAWQPPAGGAASAATAEPGRYHDVAAGLSYVPPKDWTVGFLGPGPTRSVIGPARPDGVIAQMHFTRHAMNRSPDEFTEFMAGQIPQQFEAVRNFTRSTLGDVGGRRIERLTMECTAGKERQRVRRLVYIVAQTGLQYLAVGNTSASDADRFDATFDDIARSLRIENQDWAARVAADPKRHFEPTAGFSLVVPEGWLKQSAESGDLATLYMPKGPDGIPPASIVCKKVDLKPTERDRSLTQLGINEFNVIAARFKKRKLVKNELFTTAGGLLGARTVVEFQPNDRGPEFRSTTFLFRDGNSVVNFTTTILMEHALSLGPVVDNAMATFRHERSASPERFHDATLGVSYVLPQDWRAGLSGEIRLGMIGPKQPTGWIPNIKVFRRSDPRPPQEFTDATANGIAENSLEGRLLARSTLIDVAGGSAERLVIECLDSETRRKMRRIVYIVARPNRQYLLIAHNAAEDGDRFDATFDSAVQSLQIEDQATADRCAAEPKRFFEPTKGFSFVPPDDWNLRTMPADSYIAMSPAKRHDRPAAVIMFGAEALDAEEKGMSLLEVSKKTYEKMASQDRNPVLLSSEIYKTDLGPEGMRTVFESQPAETLPRVRSACYVFIDGETVIVLIASVFLEDLATFEPPIAAAMKTFRLEPSLRASSPAPTAASSTTTASTAGSSPNPFLTTDEAAVPAPATPPRRSPPNPFLTPEEAALPARQVDSRGRFSFEVPAGWVATPDGGPGFRSLVGPKSADAAPMIYFAAEPVLGTLDDAVQSTLAKFGGSPPLVQPVPFTTTGGLRGRRLVIENGPSPQTATRFVLFLFIDGPTKYGVAGAVTGAVGDRYDFAFDECARSFQVEKH